jgi:uncharacterized protein
MRLITRLLGIALVAILYFTEHSTAQTFECQDAYTPDELTICERQGLQDLDFELAQLYQDALNQSHNSLRYMIEEMQATWVRARNRCGTSRRCIRRHYRARIREISGLLERNAAPQAPAAPAGCTIYRDENFSGESVLINPNEQVSFWGTNWDNTLSSARMGPGCQMTGFTRALYNGRDEVYSGEIAGVGEMNDRISSVRCVCQ